MEIMNAYGQKSGFADVLGRSRAWYLMSLTYCTISTKCSVTDHKQLWTEHLRCFVTGRRWLWTLRKVSFCIISAYLAQFGLKNEQFWCLSRLNFACEHCLQVLTSVTRHTPWTLGRNGTVSPVHTQCWCHLVALATETLWATMGGSSWERFEIGRASCRERV